MTRTGVFRYVPIGAVDDYLAMGWMVIADLGATHGQWSVLAWHCECRPAPTLKTVSTVFRVA